MKIPIFKSHYSIGRSILTLEKAGSSSPTEPDSIIDLCNKYKIKDLFLVEDNPSGFLEALKNSNEANINLNFGIRFNFCQNMKEKTDESRSKVHKVIIFARNQEAVKDLMKLYEIASKEGFYYFPRLDFARVLPFFENSKNLLMCIPFYDSFIENNFLRGKFCVPEFKNIKPVFFIEKNDLPFDDLIRNRAIEYCNKYKYTVIETQTVYYNLESDFEKYLAFRCINNRSSIAKPELEGFSSRNFCLENLYK